MTSSGRRVLLLSLVLPLYFLLIWHVLKPVLGQLSVSDLSRKGLLSAVSYDNANATYHFLLGRFYHYGSDSLDVNKAIAYYKESLRRCPLQGGCWLDLAKACQTAGLTADAGNAIERAVKLNYMNPAVLWEAGVFYLVTGDMENSIKNFREFILLKPESQEAAYDMIWKLPLDPEYVLRNLMPDSYSYHKRYLLYLVSTDRPEESRDLWKEMARFNVEDELFVKYLDYLIAGQRYGDADSAWKDYLGRRFKGPRDDPSLVWNGSFEHDILNGGFDWKIAETKGVDVFLDRDSHILGERSLGVSFDGTQNPEITIASQVVRVEPVNKYLLRGDLKTQSLTTTNGLVLSVEGLDCKGLYKRSDVVTGTTFWKEVSIEFETPAGCNAIAVKIRRERSSKFDNKISGSAWIDGINLAQR